MAGTTGILVIGGLTQVGVPTNPSSTASLVAWSFPIPTGGDLMTAAAAFAATLNLPTGVSAQVFDASTSSTYTLAGQWTTS